MKKARDYKYHGLFFMQNTKCYRTTILVVFDKLPDRVLSK